MSVASMAVVLGAAACAGHRDPSYVEKNLAAVGIEKISVAPIADARENKFRDVSVLADVRRAVDGALSEKGYAIVPAQFSRNGMKLGADEIAAMSNRELAAVAPSDARFLIITAVESISRDVGELGKTIEIKLNGRLVDLSSGRELWRDIAEGDADLGGLLTVLTGPAPDNEAAYDAARTLFSTLPDGPGRKGGAKASPAQDTSGEAVMPHMRPTQER